MYYTASTDANVCSSTDVQERELEDLLIDGISAGAVGGKLDQKSRVFEVILLIFFTTRRIPLGNPSVRGTC